MGNWKDIFKAHVIIIIKSEVSTFPIVIIFSVVVCLRCFENIFCHLLHIRFGKTGNLFSLLLCSLWWVQIVGHVLACRSYTFVCTVHHRIIIIVQTYLKTLNLSNASQIILLSVCIFSVIHYTICGALCFQFTHFPCDDYENILCLSVIIKSEVWAITHC